MSRYLYLMIICFAFIFSLNCSKPNEIKTIKTPIDGIFFTIETSYGRAAMDSDITEVYANLERNGRKDKTLVLHGQNMTVSNIVCVNDRNYTICVDSGITTISNGEIALKAGDASEKIHCHFQQPSNSNQNSVPNGKEH